MDSRMLKAFLGAFLATLAAAAVVLVLASCGPIKPPKPPEPPEPPPAQCPPLNVPWCNETTPPMSCGECQHQPPGEKCPVMAPKCPTPPPVDPPPVTPPTGCWSDESKMVVVPGSPTMQSAVIAAMKRVQAFTGTPAAMLERLAADLRAAGTCAFAGQEAVFVLDDLKFWQEYHAVYFADGIVGQWIPGGKYMATHRGDQTVPPPVTSLCGEPVPPPLVDFNLHCGNRWCDATPIVFGCDFCAAIGLGEMPGQPGVKRCNCPPGNEDFPAKRMACERQVVGGKALWRSSTGVEVNPENHLQARCSTACAWIEVCRADGTKCTRVSQ